jgi:hypothetical protein
MLGFLNHWSHVRIMPGALLEVRKAVTCFRELRF